MKKLALAVAATALLLGATTAQAQNLMYGEVAVQSVDADLSTNPTVLRGTLGYDFNPNLAFEGMLGLGLSKGKDTYSGIPVSLKINHLWGVYVKPKVKINDAFELFGRVGYGGMKVTATASAYGYTASESADGSDFSYGVGASYKINPQMSVTADYMKFNEADTFSVGMNFRF